jgi:hypothetical protein
MCVFVGARASGRVHKRACVRLASMQRVCDMLRRHVASVSTVFYDIIS